MVLVVYVRRAVFIADTMLGRILVRILSVPLLKRLLASLPCTLCIRAASPTYAGMWSHLLTSASSLSAASCVPASNLVTKPIINARNKIFQLLFFGSPVLLDFWLCSLSLPSPDFRCLRVLPARGCSLGGLARGAAVWHIWGGGLFLCFMVLVPVLIPVLCWGGVLALIGSPGRSCLVASPPRPHASSSADAPYASSSMCRFPSASNSSFIFYLLFL